MKGTYCDPHLQNRDVKLCSHQPSPKETIWFSGIRLDRLSNVSFVLGVFLSIVFALFNIQCCSMCKTLPAMFYRISQKTRNFAELLGKCPLGAPPTKSFAVQVAPRCQTQLS